MIQIAPRELYPLSPYLYMQFAEPLSNADSSVDAAWDYVGNRWQPDAVEILKSLAPPMIRWGGCFASYYHWREGVGPRNRRRPMLNLCWDGVYSNQVGTAEFVELCRLLGAEPLMCVNMESDGRRTWAEPFPGANRRGSAREAAEWVAYCNEPGHKLRSRHGAPEPYNIRYWQIGNETSYGYREAAGRRKFVRDGFSCKEAIAVSRRFARAMRKVDPNLKLIVWGDDGWAPEICGELGDLIDLAAFHCHFPCGPGDEGRVLAERYEHQDPGAVWFRLMSASAVLDRKISEMAEQVRPFGKRLAMTEGHFCIDDGRDRGDVLSCWAAGVAYARNLNVIARHGDLLEIATSADFFGNRWRVNAVMLPTPAYAGNAYLMPVGEVMRLFRHHSGAWAVPVTCSDSSADAAASMSGNTVYLHLVNTCPDRSLALPLRVAGRAVASATAWEISADPWLETVGLNPHCFEPRKRRIDLASYRLPPAGVAAVELELAPECS